VTKAAFPGKNVASALERARADLQGGEIRKARAVADEKPGINGPGSHIDAGGKLQAVARGIGGADGLGRDEGIGHGRISDRAWKNKRADRFQNPARVDRRSRYVVSPAPLPMNSAAIHGGGRCVKEDRARHIDAGADGDAVGVGSGSLKSGAAGEGIDPREGLGRGELSSRTDLGLQGDRGRY